VSEAPLPGSEGGGQSPSRLIDAAKKGSKDALGELLREEQLFLRQAAQEELPSALRAKEGLSDVVQQTNAAACENIGKFRGGSKGEFRGWLRVILRSRVFNAIRRYLVSRRRAVAKEQPLGDLEPSAGESSPSAVAMRREEAEALERALAALPEDYYRVIMLHHREGLSFDEVGARMNKSKEAARKLWARALHRLHEELGPSHG
jgi:RNA polymerase sigma-70 factor (ECF subfamily)